MPVMLIFLAILALLIWGNLSKKSASHPLNNLGSPNPLTPVCSTENTVGDNMGSGCAIAAGVTEPCTSPHTVLTCNHIGIVSQFPVDPPPLAIQKPPIIATPILPKPVTVSPWAPTPISTPAPPQQIFPVPVGYHNNILPIRPTSPVLLRQRLLRC